MLIVLIFASVLGASDVLFFHGQIGVEMSQTLSVTGPAEQCPKPLPPNQ